MFGALSIAEFGIIIFAVPSLILYILVLMVLIKKRKIPPLNSHFFHLCISLGVADVATGVHSFVAHYFRYWNWIDYYPLFNHAKMGRFFRVLNVAPGTYLFHVQYQGVLAMAINRYFGIAYLNKQLWTDRVHVRNLVTQWLFPIVVSAPVLTQNPTFYMQNTTLGGTYAQIAMPPEFVKVYHLGITTSVAFAVIFSMAFLYFLTYRSIVKTAKEHQLSDNIKTEVRLALIGFILFVIMVAQQAAFFMSFIANISYRRLGFHMTIVFCFVNPFLLLACSKPFREQFFFFIKFSKPTNKVSASKPTQQQWEAKAANPTQQQPQQARPRSS